MSGAVPVHFKIYDGNTTDDQTHRHTWLRVAEVVGNSDFLYVADSKLCSHDNLAFIGGKNGRFLTVMPRTWKEWSLLQKYVQEQPESLWCEISKEPAKRGRAKAPNIYWGFEYPKKTEGGYRLLCYRSSRKMKDDALARQRKLQRFRQWNQTHSAKPKRFDSVAKAEEYGKRQVQEKKVTPWVRCWVQERRQTHKKQVGRGRPGPQTPYETREEIWYEAAFAEDQEAIEADAKWDGMFSLITNDVSLKLKEVLEKYKYQPFLEKRFEQMKTVFGVMPVWLKKPERISGLLFVYFVVLLVQALLEREVRLKMKEQKIEELPLYPEGRMTKRPTAELILSAFEGLRRHRLMDERGCALRTFHDPLSPVARQILQLLGVDSSPFGFP